MKFLGKNSELIEALSGELTLTSARLQKIDIYSGLDNELHIDLYIELLYAKANNQLKLAFTGIKEFSLYYRNDLYFYNIEIYKFFQHDQGVYLSLDPYDEQNVILPEDQDFILSSDIAGVILDY